MVSFRGVGFEAGGKAVLREFSLELAAGETVALLGSSGAGKTTALKLVNALLMPSSGDVLVEGRSTRDWDCVRLRRRIGYVIQETGLFPHYTVAQNVGLVPRLEGWPQPRIDARVDEMLDLVSLPPAEFRQRMPRQLSGGQRQRVGVARALAADPPLLLLDEPFGAVDPITRAALQREFVSLAGRLGKSALFVTHDVREALVVAGRVALLVDGRLEVLASPREFVQSPLPVVRPLLESLEWRP